VCIINQQTAMPRNQILILEQKMYQTPPTGNWLGQREAQGLSAPQRP
jgi:hypothetical protein